MADDLVGLIPAAGRAHRLAGVTAVGGASKEVLPVGRSRRPAAAFLLDRFARAGITRAYVVLRAGKWDVPERLAPAPERTAGPDLAYLVLEESASVAETLDQAWPFVRGLRVALGFPDVLFRPADAFARVRARQERTGADAVLGLVPTDRPGKADVVDVTPAGEVVRLRIKPAPGEDLPDPPWTWIAAVWSPALTELLHREVAAVREDLGRGPAGRELYPGDVLARALEEGLRIEAVTFPQGRHLDIGTPEDLERANDWRDDGDPELPTPGS